MGSRGNGGSFTSVGSAIFTASCHEGTRIDLLPMVRHEYREERALRQFIRDSEMISVVPGDDVPTGIMECNTVLDTHEA